VHKLNRIRQVHLPIYTFLLEMGGHIGATWLITLTTCCYYYSFPQPKDQSHSRVEGLYVHVPIKLPQEPREFPRIAHLWYVARLTLSRLPYAGREMSTGQSLAMLCGWGIGGYGSFHLWINVRVAGKTV